MSGSITLSVRGLVLTAVVALAVVVAYLAGTVGGGSGPASVAGAADGSAEAGGGAVRTIAMTGTGEVSAVPDQLGFKLSVSTKADDVSTALAQANQTLRRVLTRLEALGVQREDMRTSGLSVRPDYDYTQYGTVLTGYAVKESAGVLVRKLALGGKALAAAVRAGGNAVRVHDVGLRIGDRDALMKQARDAAVAEARAKAEQYAAAAGQTLDGVITLREVGSGAPRTPVPTYLTNGRAAADLAAVGKVPVRAGSQDLKVSVAIVWELSA